MKLPEEGGEDQYGRLRKTIFPIQVGGKQVGGEGITGKGDTIGDSDTDRATTTAGNTTPPPASSVTSDLPASPPVSLNSNSGGPSPPRSSRQDWRVNESPLLLASGRQRSLSPVFLAYSAGQRPTLRRQNTFVEAAVQTAATKPAAEDSKSAQTVQPQFRYQISQTEISTAEQVGQSCQTEPDAGRDPVPRQLQQLVHQTSQTEEYEVGRRELTEDRELLCPAVNTRKSSGRNKNEANILTRSDVIQSTVVAEFGMQTIPVLLVQSMVQTDPLPISMEYVLDEMPVLARTPCRELTFGSTQTEPQAVCATEVQTCLRSLSGSPTGSSLSGGRHHTFVLNSRSSLTDEIVARVLLEHADRVEESCYNGHVTGSDQSARPVSSSEAKHTSPDRSTIWTCPDWEMREKHRILMRYG